MDLENLVGLFVYFSFLSNLILTSSILVVLYFKWRRPIDSMMKIVLVMISVEMFIMLVLWYLNR